MQLFGAVIGFACFIVYETLMVVREGARWVVAQGREVWGPRVTEEDPVDERSTH